MPALTPDQAALVASLLKGDPGSPGLAGATGPVGPMGPPGPAGAPGAGSVARMRLADPSYFYPTYSKTGTADLWGRMISKAPVARIMVINPASGPGNSASAAYVEQVKRAQAGGMLVFGYLTQNYRDRFGIQGDGVKRDNANIGNVKAEMDRHTAFYKVDGWFLDEMDNLNAPENLDYCRQLYAHGVARGGMIVQNPGASFPELLVDTAHVFMSFESSAASYRTHQPMPWMRYHPASKFWHCVHTCSAAELAEMVALAKTRNVGWFYATDDVMANPYDTIPTYLDDLVAKLGA